VKEEWPKKCPLPKIDIRCPKKLGENFFTTPFFFVLFEKETKENVWKNKNFFDKSGMKKKMKISSSLLFGWFEKLEKNCLFVSHDSTIKRKKEEAKWVKKM